MTSEIASIKNKNLPDKVNNCVCSLYLEENCYITHKQTS